MSTRVRIVCILVVVIGIASFIPGQVVAQDELTFSLRRTFGTALGNTIQGTFTIDGQGPADIQTIRVYFNNVQVHSVDSNSISWAFNTDDYPAGDTNITLVGWDGVEDAYSASIQRVFMGEILGSLFTGVIIVFVVVLALIKYVPTLMKRGK